MLIKKNASGSVASFDEGADGIPVEKLVIGIEPVQAGSGDPSPSNVRAISGWTGANIKRAGKNFAKIWAVSQTGVGLTFTVNNDKSITVSGTASSGYSYYIAGTAGSTTPIIKLVEGVTYTFSGCNVQVNGATAYAAMDTPKTYTASKGDYINYIWLYLTNGQAYNKTFYPQIEVGSSATEYEMPVEDTISVSFGSAGTVYGGTLDVTTGLLTVTHGSITLNGSENWTYNSTKKYIYWETNVNTVPYLFSQQVQMISSVYPFLTAGYNTDHFAGHDKIFSAWANDGAGQQTYRYLYIKNTDYNSLEEYKNALASQNVQIVFELQNQKTYQLTPAQIKTLLGTNNIWADTGETEVTYIADATKVIETIEAAIQS